MACMEIWGGNRPIDTGLATAGIDVWVYSRPYAGSAEGGDIQYVSSCAAGFISRMIVADVAGHGEDVGGLATDLRKLMRRHINTPDQSRFARALNEAFTRSARGGRFATAVLGTYLTEHRALIVCNAGHPRPLVYRAATGVWGVLADQATAGSEAMGIANLPLGVIEPTEYSQVAIRLAKDDVVLIYTDALLESRGGLTGEMLGEAGLIGVLRGLEPGPPSTLIRRLVAAVRARAGGAEFADDVTALVVHQTDRGIPERTMGEKARSVAKMLGLMPV